MRNREHAPSPWHVEPLQWDHGASIAICNKQKGVLAVIEPLNDAEDGASARRDECDYPNAYLMAAAPDLLAACRMVVERWERGDLAEAARACAAAIALATTIPM